MDVRELRYFIAVFTHQSVTRAAESLYLSQPALSRAVRDLEDECGVNLFLRTPNGVVPTAAGHTLYRRAKAIVRLVDETSEVVRDGATSTELVEVGLAPGLDPAWLDAVYETVRRQVPAAGLAFVDLVSTEQVRQVRQGRLDLGLVHEADPPGLVGSLVKRDILGVATPPGSDLAHGGGRVRLAQLDGVRVLSHARDQVSTIHDQLLAAAKDSLVTPRWRFAAYLENAALAARAADAQAILMSSSTRSRLLPSWTWRPLTEPEVAVDTYIVHAPTPRPVVLGVADAVRSLEGPDGAGDRPRR